MHISKNFCTFALEKETNNKPLKPKTRKGKRNMITISEIVSDALKESENNVYYWDSLNDRGYHIHIYEDESYICFRQSPRRTDVISPEVFEEAINKKCFGNSIGEDSYYSSFRKTK